MTIGNLEVIDIGLPNESTGSDSLYLAFNKTKNNFAILANAASQYVTFTGNTGIGVNANPNTGAVDITNTGVISLTAGSGVTLSANTGNITISTTGGGGNGSGTVTSVGVTSSTLTVTNSPIVGAGNIVLDLPTTGVVASQYTNPTVTVDTYGRITNIANNTVSGTVTSVSITPGTGVQVTTSGVPNVNPGFTVINTGVTRVSAGSGIQVSSGNGNVTISTTPVAAVTSVSVASTSLTVTGSPITGSGTITVNLPSNISITGNIIGGNIDIPNGRANVTGTANAVGGGATVGVRSILAIDSAFGSNNVNDPASAQAVRGRVTGSNLTKTRNYVAGVTGQYLVTGTNASEFINTGLLGVVGDQTTTANAAVVAYLDGDGGLTTAGSAYGVSMKNSTPGSGFDYGLDLQFINLNVAGTTTPFKQADIRFNNGVTLVANTAGNISINANVTVGNIIGNGQALTGIAGANVTGNVGNANLSQYLNVSDVNNNFSYHVVLSAGSGDKSLHIDADDNLQYNPSDGTLTSTRVDATYVLANLNFANGYLASNLVGSTSNIVNGNSNVSITTANGDITLSAVGTANVLVITGTGANITGTANISGTANVGNLNSTSIVKTGVFVTANIPAAATAGAGARAFVTDATVATFGSAYVGGAANAVPVYSDGTGWFIG